jgi:hypothetical protein
MPRNAIVGARKTYLKAAGRTTKYSSAGAVFLTMPETSAGAAPKGSPKSTLPALSLAALSIVFGDIGASPLNTFKTVLDLTGAKPEAGAILGSLSLILWTLIIVTSVKYVGFATRVDNDGEGGILALMSLLGVKKQNRPAIVAIGLFGAALIYGDGAITPAISVLSERTARALRAAAQHDLRAKARLAMMTRPHRPGSSGDPAAACRSADDRDHSHSGVFVGGDRRGSGRREAVENSSVDSSGTDRRRARSRSRPADARNRSRIRSPGDAAADHLFLRGGDELERVSL